MVSGEGIHPSPTGCSGRIFATTVFLLADRRNSRAASSAYFQKKRCMTSEIRHTSITSSMGYSSGGILDFCFESPKQFVI